MTTLIIATFGIILFFSLALRAPNTFHVERTTTIEALVGDVYPLVADLRNWALWSPYEKLDMHMKKTLSGAESGVGAIYEWDGNARAGSGRMEIIGTEAQMITLTLDMFRPIKGHNEVRFIFSENKHGTSVTWAMDGKNSMISKVMGLFFDMDNMIGKDFAEGLQNLKEVVETPPASDAETMS